MTCFRRGRARSRLRVLVGGLLALAVLLSGAAGRARPVTAAEPTLSPESAPWYHLDAQGRVLIDLYFGWTSTCPHCARARPFIQGLADEYPWLAVHSLQVDGDNEANVRFLVALANRIGEQIEGVPAFLLGARLYTGFDTAETTGVQLRAELLRYREQVLAQLGTPAPATPAPSTAAPAPEPVSVAVPLLGTVDVSSLSLPVLTVMLAGLDAFNPCALSVLLFLLSVLVGTRRRARMALVGGTFVFVSGLAYFVFMAAWLNLFLLAGELRIVTLAAGAAAVAAALINVKDYFWFRRGVSLMIPEAAKPGIFGRMLDVGESTKLSAMLVGTVLVAVAVNAYEMLCTGGFPVVFTRILTLSQLPASAYYLYLVLYNVVYVLPLLLIVAGFTWTLGSRGVTEREARTLKLLSGLLMLGLGLLLLIAPQLLSNLSASLAVFGTAVAATAVLALVDRIRRRRVAARVEAPPHTAPRDDRRPRGQAPRGAGGG